MHNGPDYFTSAKGAIIIEKSWTKAGVAGIINSSIILPSADPFEDINLISIIFRGEKILQILRFRKIIHRKQKFIWFTPYF